MSSSHLTQFWGDKMQNYVLYLTPLLAIKMSNKEGVTVDTVFYLPQICMSGLENFKNINFLPWDCRNI